MQVTTITVSFTGTIPTQPYGNVVIQQTWTATIDPHENPEACSSELHARIRGQVLLAVKPIVAQKVKGMESALAQLDKETREKVKAQLDPAIWLASNMPETSVGMGMYTPAYVRDLENMLHAEHEDYPQRLRTLHELSDWKPE